ncbi:uncharacterized protein N7459_000167 [Penicillium hispanicum]|uniref:uncharacterized protein n=1 Tax=Penicillium hispanicum TaxID=1080232 RepID=UPI0025413281|nr:uncharacterized protein N7459_000167 [Penicillium hispanicum]KAJ5593959.1 hypothetical protein N7459_000167 [Penicillium hispanicum]
MAPTLSKVLTKRAPAPRSLLSQAIIYNGMIHCSGAVGTDPQTNKLVPGTVRDRTAQALKNLIAVIEDAGSNVRQVVKVNIYLTSIDDFSEMNAAYEEVFNAEPKPRQQRPEGLEALILMLEYRGHRREGERLSVVIPATLGSPRIIESRGSSQRHFIAYSKAPKAGSEHIQYWIKARRTLHRMAFYVIIGAGVVGLTTALELKARHPSAKIVIAAKYLPGDAFPDYTSNWGGANWFPASSDNGRQEKWDSITYKKFQRLSTDRPDSGVKAMDIRFHYDQPIEDVGILTPSTGKLWFEDLVGGLKPIAKGELPNGAAFGFEMASFVLDVQRYLPWLQMEAISHGIEIHRKIFTGIRDVFKMYPQASTVFNCTGLGSLTLGGVEDKKLYPARGQILLVEGPKDPIRTMYFRAPHRDADATHIFPRGKDGMGGVILGGCRQKNNWDGEVDLEFAEVIKQKCCALVPQLGKPEDLKIIKHGVGFRPSREGGARIEPEYIDGKLVIHNYGAGGTGFQASWGMAQEAVDLVPARARL